ncbi:MAG TPA: FAD-dependent oxidoreductase [Candidatus Sulfotelmatobacter sp.]|jgi:glycine/D-amino acid oxidase-like deaminating enzyme|nr:FAD-dependent oxidoreductase [Candidatus Sulfotelmatobacter sp.]
MSQGVYDVAIVGAGIVGAACADEFARRRMSVVILDRDVVGSGATAAGMGHIVVMDDSDAQFALTRYSQQLWRALRPELPVDVEYESCGTIWVAADEEEMTEVRRKHDYYAKRGVPTEVLDSQALRSLEPNLRPDMAGGLLVPEDGVLYPPCAARFLTERAQKNGAKLHLGASIAQIGKRRVRLSDGLEITAEIIVNAAGAWAPELTPGIEIKKRKGHLVITDRYPGFVRHQLVELGYLKSAHSVSSDSVAFNVQPRRTGQILIGSSRQYGAEHKEVDQAILKRMLQRAQEYMPALGSMSAVRSWTGFRAATPDKLPLIGPWSEDKSVLLATGHEGLGITTSLGTAKMLVDQVTGSTPEIPIEPYLPSRAEKEFAHA